MLYLSGAPQEFQTLLEVIELESLSLLNCRLGTVPSAVTLHQSLRRLAVRGCGLTHLTPGPYLEFLRELDLRENGLSSAPEEALAAPLLDFLYVTGACFWLELWWSLGDGVTRGNARLMQMGYAILCQLVDRVSGAHVGPRSTRCECCCCALIISLGA